MLNSEADLVLPRGSLNLALRMRNLGPPCTVKNSRAVKTLVSPELFPWPRLSGCYLPTVHLFLVAHGPEVRAVLTHQRWRTASEQLPGDLTLPFRVESACE